MGMFEQLDHAVSIAANADAGCFDRERQLVSGACTALQSSASHPPSLAEVCDALHTTPGALDTAFCQVLGIGLGRCVKAMRLAAVQRELAGGLRPGVTVYDTAARWGFWHFGRFSTEYRHHFDEWPAETLQNAAARSDRAPAQRVQ